MASLVNFTYSFDKKPKKYALVLADRNPENKRKRTSEVLKPFELTKCPESRLGEELQSSMKAVVSDLHAEMRQILGPPQTFCPNTVVSSKSSISRYVNIFDFFPSSLLGCYHFDLTYLVHIIKPILISFFFFFLIFFYCDTKDTTNKTR